MTSGFLHKKTGPSDSFSRSRLFFHADLLDSITRIAYLRLPPYFPDFLSFSSFFSTAFFFHFLASPRIVRSFVAQFFGVCFLPVTAVSDFRPCQCFLLDLKLGLVFLSGLVTVVYDKAQDGCIQLAMYPILIHRKERLAQPIAPLYGLEISMSARTSFPVPPTRAATPCPIQLLLSQDF